MNVQKFLGGRPCLEEIDGFLLGCRLQIDLLDNPQYPEITADVIGPLETYRAQLMSGKVTPAPSEIRREFIYQKGRAPKRRRAPPPVRPATGGQAKVFDANRRGKR